MSAGTELQDRLDDIYRGEQADFTKGRDALAKELKGAGEGELSAEVKKLKRPTKAAATLNRLSLTRAKETGRVLEAGAELRRIQENLSDPGAGEKLRAASAEHQDAVEAALEIAASELEASGQTLDRIGETLRATASNESIAEAVRAGRLEREGQAAGLGEALVATGRPRATPSMGKSASGSKSTSKAGGSRSRGDAAAKRKAEKDAAKARRKRRAAEGKLERAESKLAMATEDESEAGDRLREVERDLRAVKATHDAAVKTVDRLRKAVDHARRDLDELN